MKTPSFGGKIFPALLIVGALFTGCTTVKITDPARTATEQLLLSTAVDHALRGANLEVFAGHKVYLDAAYFESYDSKYVVGGIRDALSRAGALLVDNATNSDIVMEARSGALSIDSSSYLFGIPSMGIPVPLAGQTQTPELALYKSDHQRSTAKIALLAFARETRAHIYSSGPLDGKSDDSDYKLLFVSWVSTDVPEKLKGKKSMQNQTWFPQYDLTNLPAAHSLTNNLPPGIKSSTNAPSVITNTVAMRRFD